MRIKLSVVVGPQRGREFNFDGHDIFLAGRHHRCDFQVDDKDKAFSRVHFMLEVNPPLCRLVDLGSRNGTLVNGRKIGLADLRNGDQIQVGQSAFRMTHLSEPTIGVAAETDEPLSGVLFRSPLSGSKSGVEKLPPGIPRQVGGFRILRLIGKGIAGTTLAGIRESDNHPVAVKIIDPPMTGARPVLDKLLHDLGLLCQLQEKRILRILEYGESVRQIYVVSDLVPGIDAGKFLLQRGPLEPPIAIGLIRPTLLALEYGHGQGLAHGALKPTNILIEEKSTKGRVSLSDYGVTTVYESSPLSGMTLTNDIGSAIHYLPPERLSHFRLVTPACDQYSIAATLYHLLTGAHIHNSESHVHPLARIVLEDPVSIRMRRQDLREDFAIVIHRALSREPDDRYASITEFREALEAFL